MEYKIVLYCFFFNCILLGLEKEERKKILVLYQTVFGSKLGIEKTLVMPVYFLLWREVMFKGVIINQAKQK